MKRRKFGLVILSIWGILEILVAATVTVITLTKGQPPALQLSMVSELILRVEPQAIAVINAQAALANPLIIGFCVLVLAMLWSPHPKYPSGLHPVVIPVLAFIQLFAFISDGYLGNQNLAANLLSTGMLASGLACVVTAKAPGPA
jgi:hypothetical protein